MHNHLIHTINRRIASRLSYRGRVLDLGCGTCPYKARILEEADEYIGVDWGQSHHDLSQVDVHADLTERLPFDGAYADTVVAFQVLEHIPDPTAFVAECSRVLRPGGALHLTVPFMWYVHEEPHDYQRFTRYGLERLLVAQGFVDVDVRANTGFWQCWILKFNYHTARYAGPLARQLWKPVWLLGQWLAPHLDKRNPDESETASYTVSARKPPSGPVA